MERGPRNDPAARVNGKYGALDPPFPHVDAWTPLPDGRVAIVSAHVGQATLPVHSRIVGFGVGVAYVARTDPTDDQVYLERHRKKS